MWSHGKFREKSKKSKSVFQKADSVTVTGCSFEPELPSALELTLMTLNVPEEFHLRKMEMIKSLQSEVHWNSSAQVPIPHPKFFINNNNEDHLCTQVYLDETD